MLFFNRGTWKYMHSEYCFTNKDKEICWFISPWFRPNCLTFKEPYFPLYFVVPWWYHHRLDFHFGINYSRSRITVGKFVSAIPAPNYVDLEANLYAQLRCFFGILEECGTQRFIFWLRWPTFYNHNFQSVISFPFRHI